MGYCGKMTEKNIRVQLLLPADTVVGINDLVSDGHFISRQDAIRFLLKSGLENHENIAKSSVLKNTPNQSSEVSE
jgi:hypothetical protein